MEFKDPHDLIEFQKLQEMEQQRAQLQSIADSPDLLPEVRGAYEVALDQLNASVLTEAQKTLPCKLGTLLTA